MIYRVRWEERKRPACACCTDENHPWKAVTSENGGGIITSHQAAERYTNKLWDYHGQNGTRSPVEIRDVVIEQAQEPEWVQYGDPHYQYSVAAERSDR